MSDEPTIPQESPTAQNPTTESGEENKSATSAIQEGNGAAETGLNGHDSGKMAKTGRGRGNRVNLAPPFTSQNASMMAHRSWEARRAKAAAPLAMPDASNESFTASSLERVKKQIEAIDRLMDKASDAREWDQLSRAKERLFKAYVHLAGIPGPGQLRPQSPRKSRSAGQASIDPAAA